MFVNVVCDRCSSIIHKMKVLRSVKEISNQLNNLCPCCAKRVKSVVASA